jgi:hypothetical protein
MKAMNLTMSIGSLLLLPIISEPFHWCNTKPCLLKTDWYLKWFLTAVNLALGVFIAVFAGKLGSQMTFNDQICFVVSLSLTFIMGVLGWNMLRVVLNWVLAPFRTKNWAIRGLTA